MPIVVTDLDNVLVDGQPAGNVVNVMANYRARVGETFAALKAFANAEKQNHAAALADVIAERDALGTKPEARTILKARRREEAELRKAAAEKELADLNAD